jgi:hypothetical protein
MARPMAMMVGDDAVDTLGALVLHARLGASDAGPV